MLGRLIPDVSYRSETRTGRSRASSEYYTTNRLAWRRCYFARAVAVRSRADLAHLNATVRRFDPTNRLTEIRVDCLPPTRKLPQIRSLTTMRPIINPCLSLWIRTSRCWRFDLSGRSPVGIRLSRQIGCRVGGGGLKVQAIASHRRSRGRFRLLSQPIAECGRGAFPPPPVWVSAATSTLDRPPASRCGGYPREDNTTDAVNKFVSAERHGLSRTLRFRRRFRTFE